MRRSGQGEAGGNLGDLARDDARRARHLPGARPIWLVIPALGVLATLALLRETQSASYSAA